MYLPEPLLALVVSYITDGQPARRILAGCRRGQVVKGWKSEDTVEYCMWVANGTWFSNWGAVRRALDIAAYVTAKEAGEHARLVALIVPDHVASSTVTLARTRLALTGEWALFPRRAYIDVYSGADIFYDYEPRVFVDILSVSSYLNFTAYVYFICLLDINGCSSEQLKELLKRQAEGRGLIM
jgi:hypothetical protein